uniref:Uncharacterized protein n=1 Tax=Trichuris muris TaxID=70415 RepID=A0A5S6Q2S8_TRIMR
MAESRRKVYRSRQDLWDTLETNMYRAFNRSNSDGQSRTELWYSQSQSYTPATKRLMLSEKWDFGDIDVEQGGSGSSGECRLQELVDRVLELPPNGGDLWIYVNNNIMGQECREAASIPSEGRGDQKFSRQFLNYYEFGPRMRFGEATNAYNDTQLYRLVEGVYKRMMESSAADHFLNARSTLFCRPMPPSKIFNMISKVKPSLGSPETIQARYFNTLTDPLEPRVNKASEIAYSDSPTASHQAWFLQGLCPMCLMFGCSSHSYGIYSQLLGKVPSCCQNVGNEMNGAMVNVLAAVTIRGAEFGTTNSHNKAGVKKLVLTAQCAESCF